LIVGAILYVDDTNLLCVCALLVPQRIQHWKLYPHMCHRSQGIEQAQRTSTYSCHQPSSKLPRIPFYTKAVGITYRIGQVHTPGLDQCTYSRGTAHSRGRNPGCKGYPQNAARLPPRRRWTCLIDLRFGWNRELQRGTWTLGSSSSQGSSSFSNLLVSDFHPRHRSS
jgi:hypothetical protein